MRGFFKRVKVLELARLLLPFIGAFALGVLLISWPRTWPAQETVHVLRDALLIAGIIGLGIEIWAASVLIEHTSRELSERLVGYGLPRAAQELIHDLVHETRLVYRDYRKSYRITKHATKPGVVILHVTLYYKVVNNGIAALDYGPGFSEEGMYNPTVQSLQYRDHALGPNDIQQTRSDTGVISVIAPKKVRLLPSEATAALETLKAEQVCAVRWSYTVEMPDYYSDVTAFGGVTINPVLELEEMPQDLDFNASGGNECAHQPGGATWVYNRAFIGGQHTRVWWKPRNP